MQQHLNCRGPRRRRERKCQKIFEEIIVENSPNMEKENSHSSPGSAESPIQDKPKEKNAKTHINQTKNIEYKEKIVKAAREKQQITHKGIPMRLSADLSAETLQARRERHDILKVMKGK